MLTRPSFAGSDTTATALRSTLLNIITNPAIYSKLQKEIDAAVAREAISETIQHDEAVRELPYLQACIKEGLRIFPPITALRERVTPPEGDIINGHHIPGGVNVGLNMRGVLQNPVFGADPEVYRPGRWIESSPDTLAEMKRVQELVFGHGFTRCLGINIATMNLNKVLAEVSVVPSDLRAATDCFISASKTLRYLGCQPVQSMEKPLSRYFLPTRILREDQATRRGSIVTSGTWNIWGHDFDIAVEYITSHL